MKSRTLAARLVSDGAVRVNGIRAGAPARQVRPGDVLTIALERRVLVLRIVAPGERRGPAPLARLLYDDLAEPAPAALETAAGEPAPLPWPNEKRDRRAARALKRRAGFGEAPE